LHVVSSPNQRREVQLADARLPSFNNTLERSLVVPLRTIYEGVPVLAGVKTWKIQSQVGGRSTSETMGAISAVCLDGSTSKRTIWVKVLSSDRCHACLIPDRHWLRLTVQRELSVLSAQRYTARLGRLRLQSTAGLWPLRCPAPAAPAADIGQRGDYSFQYLHKATEPVIQAAITGFVPGPEQGAWA
jgi:hypothetical protein